MNVTMYPCASATACDHGTPIHIDCGLCEEHYRARFGRRILRHAFAFALPGTLIALLAWHFKAWQELLLTGLIASLVISAGITISVFADAIRRWRRR